MSMQASGIQKCGANQEATYHRTRCREASGSIVQIRNGPTIWRFNLRTALACQDISSGHEPLLSEPLIHCPVVFVEGFLGLFVGDFI